MNYIYPDDQPAFVVTQFKNGTYPVERIEDAMRWDYIKKERHVNGAKRLIVKQTILLGKVSDFGLSSSSGPALIMQDTRTLADERKSAAEMEGTAQRIGRRSMAYIPSSRKFQRKHKRAAASSARPTT